MGEVVELPDHPEPELLEVATFRSSVKKFHIDDQGRLNLLLQVPPEFKEAAFLTTNYPGTMLTFTASRRPRSSERADPGDDAA